MNIDRRLLWSMLVLAVLASLALLSACGGASPAPSPSACSQSGVQGKAMLAGGPAPGSPQPLAGVTVAVHEGELDGPIVAKTRAGADGSFRFDLPPGTYTLIELSDGARPETVVIEPGRYATVTLTINAK